MRAGTDTAEGKTGTVALEEDGSYQVRMEAADGAGHIASAAREVYNRPAQSGHTLYRRAGRHISKKLSAGSHLWRADPGLYYRYMHCDTGWTAVSSGETCDSEGLHILELKAVDSAGNVGTAKAEFVIDHTAPEIVFKDLKEGEAYEETHTFQVTVSDQNDTIQEIRINGIRQATSGHSKIYQYTAEEEKSYEGICKGS